LGGFLFGNEFDLGQWPDHRSIERSHVTGALRAPPRPRFELEELLWRGSRFGECRGMPPSSTMGGQSTRVRPSLPRLGCRDLVNHAYSRATETNRPMPSRAERERTQQRRALRLLADAPEGMTEALMMAHGFNSELLVDLCIAGLAIAKVERMIAGGRTVEVVRLKITETGRQALTASRGKST